MVILKLQGNTYIYILALDSFLKMSLSSCISFSCLGARCPYAPPPSDLPPAPSILESLLKRETVVKIVQEIRLINRSLQRLSEGAHSRAQPAWRQVNGRFVSPLQYRWRFNRIHGKSAQWSWEDRFNRIHGKSAQWSWEDNYYCHHPNMAKFRNVMCPHKSKANPTWVWIVKIIQFLILYPLVKSAFQRYIAQLQSEFQLCDAIKFGNFAWK
jgi:hypothetical protein